MGDADPGVPRNEEWAQYALAVRQVGGVADHLVGEGFLDLANGHPGAFTDREGDRHVGQLPVVLRVGVEAFVLATELVIDPVGAAERAQDLDAEAPPLGGTLLLADLGHAVVILGEGRPIPKDGNAGPEHEASRGPGPGRAPDRRQVRNNVIDRCCHGRRGGVSRRRHDWLGRALCLLGEGSSTSGQGDGQGGCSPHPLRCTASVLDRLPHDFHPAGRCRVSASTRA